MFIHYFFQDDIQVSDVDIIPLVENTIDQKNPREWYYALMDYGSFLKTHVENPNRKSKHYVKQSKFAGSDREIRGKILRFLLNESMMSIDDLRNRIEGEPERVYRILDSLKTEKLVQEKGGVYTISK